ncbi:hypothetical protein SAMN05216317_10887 [Nitrosomonas eutropha]|nr:hypothetical protein [Nitrosomonas sp. GH22]SDW60707.1 hypothetical protein SAMN05216317_10887 [Nitrosomonas eutropha]SEJ05988.1 hypothetical protein SAMN05216318_12242 [Nitrosomonas eutropha]
MADIHLAEDAHGMPVKILVTPPGTTADCMQVGRLIEGDDADHLLADKAFDAKQLSFFNLLITTNYSCHEQGITSFICIIIWDQTGF